MSEYGRRILTGGLIAVIAALGIGLGVSYLPSTNLSSTPSLSTASSTGAGLSTSLSPSISSSTTSTESTSSRMCNYSYLVGYGFTVNVSQAQGMQDYPASGATVYAMVTPVCTQGYYSQPFRTQNLTTSQGGGVQVGTISANYSVYVVYEGITYKLPQIKVLTSVGQVSEALEIPSLRVVEVIASGEGLVVGLPNATIAG